MKKLILLLPAVLLLCYGCAKENELKKSVFIPDSENPDLPAYSEWGYNTFGAYYDRDIFVSNDYLVPAKVSVTNEGMSFSLYGQRGTWYYQGNGNEMTLTVRMKEFKPTQFSDLAVLNDSLLDLTSPAFEVRLKDDTSDLTLQVLSGQFWFRRAQKLWVDKRLVETILSGYFEIKFLLHGEPVTISEGRFDVGIGPDNFYLY